MKIDLLKSFVINKAPIGIFLLLFCFSCGVELQLYEWENMDLRLLDTVNKDTLSPESNISEESFAILVSLNPENTIKVNSSDWINASDGFQANDKISSIEITSNKDYNDDYASGVLLNDAFRATYLGVPQVEMTIENFIEEFGQQSTTIQEGFELKPFISPNVSAVRDSLRTFTIRLALKNGGTFFQTSTSVRILE